MNQSMWRPFESEDTLEMERGWLAGILVACGAYGIVFTLFVLSLVQLLRTTSRPNLKSRLPLLVYVCLIFTSGSLFIGSASRMIQLGFIDERLFPGGPAAFEVSQFSLPVNVIANVTYVFTNWLMDGMVVWRCIVVYRGARHLYGPVVFIPAIAYLGSIALGILWLVQVSSPRSNPWSSPISINVTLPYFWLSLALNVTMTVAICGRLLFYRRQVRQHLKDASVSHYATIAAMCIESALIYTVFALCFLIPFSLDSPVQYIFLQALGEVQVIAPLLITYRVASGEAWSSSNYKEAHTYNARQTPETPIRFHQSDSTEGITTRYSAA